jgi:predicted nucleic acid-binding protein
MNRCWVINASPIISLSKINMTSLLFELCDTICIPSGVVEEINQGPGNDPAREWIQTYGRAKIMNVGQINKIVSAWDLGKGESEVIHWAYANPGFTAILDDRAARNCAVSLAIEVIGTIGILLLAKKRHKVAKVKPFFHQLEENGFRINPDLLKTALIFANEQ